MEGTASERPGAGETGQKFSLGGLARSASKAGTAAWDNLMAWHLPAMSPDYLRGDCRRQMRPYMIMFISVLHLWKMKAEVFSDIALHERVMAVVLSVGMMCVGVVARGRPESLAVDVFTLIFLYLNFYQASWCLKRDLSMPDADQIGEIVCAFTSFLQMIVAMGTHFGLAICYFVAVATTCWLSDTYPIQVSIFFLAVELLSLHAVLQLAEVRKHSERQQAQAAALRLNRLEQDRAKQRQERVELCLGMVLHHLKAPLLLMKSELSVYSDDPEMAPQAVEALRSRVGQLWSIFSGLETSVQVELGVDIDGISQSLNLGCHRAMLPQPVRLDPPLAEPAPAPGDGTWMVEPQAEPPCEPEPASPTASQGGEDDGPAEGGPEDAGDRGQLPRGEAAEVYADGMGCALPPAEPAEDSTNSGGVPLLRPNSVRALVNPLDPRLGIRALTFSFADDQDEDEDLPGLLSLLPCCGGDFPSWVQDQVNDALHAMENGSDDAGASPTVPRGRVALALPSLRLLLQDLLLHPGTFCGASLSFRGLEDVNLAGDEDKEDEGTLLAVMELSDLSLTNAWSSSS